MNNKRVLNFSLVCLIIAIYLVDNLSILDFNKKAIYIYLGRPVLWALAFFIILKLPKVKAESKVKYTGFLREWTIYLAGIYIVINILSGIILGFGRSPYSLTLIGIGQNLIALAAVTFGREGIRAYLVNNGEKKLFSARVIIITLIFTIISIPLSRILSLNNLFDIIKFSAEYVLPQLSLNILAIYLVYLGGASLSIIYLLIIQGIDYLSPILPDLNWITKAAIGALCPAFSLMFIQYVYMKKSRQLKGSGEKKESPLGWIGVSLAAIVIIWFSVGVFPVYPTVIITGSMKPLINPGDIVLVQRLKESDIKVGDVLQYKKDNIFIFHRVIAVEEDKNEVKYKFKGDNNSVADPDLVSKDIIKGKVIKVIPKLGLPTLIVKDKSKSIPREKVEF